MSKIIKTRSFKEERKRQLKPSVQGGTTRRPRPWFQGKINKTIKTRNFKEERTKESRPRVARNKEQYHQDFGFKEKSIRQLGLRNPRINKQNNQNKEFQRRISNMTKTKNSKEEQPR